MARIAGVDLPNDKKIKISLTYIFGIGRTMAMDICEKAKVDPEIRTKNLSEEQVHEIRTIIAND